MNPRAMQPYGAALRAYFEGDAGAQLLLRRDDGQEVSMPVSHFFREPSDFTTIEKTALRHCRGRVLDVGGGTGLHSLVLQQQGLSVTAIDINPQAVEIMEQRRVKDVHCADLFSYRAGPFDTLLMMGHGIGAVETVAGLDRFLAHVHGLLAAGGQVLLDSLDVRATSEPGNLAYHEANRQAGRYIGEIRIQLGYQGEQGPLCGWLHVDPETLTEHAGNAGWQCEVLVREETGDYLARLTK